MIEIPREQLDTIYELAQHAVGITRSAFVGSTPPAESLAESFETMLRSSPLAAEVFKTLVRCHIVNKSKRLEEEAKKLFKQDDHMMGPSTYPGSPSSYGGGRI